MAVLAPRSDTSENNDTNDTNDINAYVTSAQDPTAFVRTTQSNQDTEEGELFDSNISPSRSNPATSAFGAISTPTVVELPIEQSSTFDDSNNAKPSTESNGNGNGISAFLSDRSASASRSLESIVSHRVPGSPDIAAFAAATSSQHTATSPSIHVIARQRIATRNRFFGLSYHTEYEIVKKIGEGTFGEVKLGRDKRTNDMVALKRVLTHDSKEGLPITALREIRILKILSHENIISLKEIAYKPGEKGSQDEHGSIFMVFPYMDHDLAGLLANPLVKITVPQRKSFMQQLLKGVDYLHRSHIMHRDIKCANILVDKRGNLRIADFGLARSFSDTDTSGYTVMVVTRWYRPPELFLGMSRYTTAVDMWGVGCVFGEILKGKAIMPGSSDTDQLLKIWHLCGSPTEENWPGFKRLPAFTTGNDEAIIDSVKVVQRRLLRDRFSPDKHDKHTVDLLDKLLTIDPSKRITASKALEELYFFISPKPARPNTPEFVDSCHFVIAAVVSDGAVGSTD
eukprot:jgi/Hompol1/188/HPOL_005251-RA